MVIYCRAVCMNSREEPDTFFQCRLPLHHLDLSSYPLTGKYLQTSPACPPARSPLWIQQTPGQCVFITCQLYEYHFIKEEMSWDEARAYCRENYTDLAKVFDLTDMRRLQDSAQSQTEAWIGLYNITGGDNRRWHWSLPGEEYTENKTCWGAGEPNDQPYPEDCVRTVDKNNKKNKTFHLIETSVTWTQAQSYCRQHHTDLASGLDQIYSEEFKKLQKSTALWIGLFRDSWRWSDGSNFSFRYWDMDSFNDGLNNRTCATTLLERSGRWSSAGCDQRKPFFCYDVKLDQTSRFNVCSDKLILIRENKTWEEALNYCRQKHHDLVSISNPEEQRWVQERATDYYLQVRYVQRAVCVSFPLLYQSQEHLGFFLHCCWIGSLLNCSRIFVLV
ncbi:unnamed protein product [Oreochromis niloticus]|nr:unnamed protein product [Mustela putorius furo]